MSIEDKLKYYIVQKNVSVRQFSKEYNIPYGTLTSVFARGISNSSIKTIGKICDALNIDVDELLEGNIVEKNYSAKKDQSIDFKNNRDFEEIMNTLKEYMTDGNFVTIGDERLSKRDVAELFNTIEFSIENKKWEINKYKNMNPLFDVDKKD